jgi:hypothetical protein
VFGNGDVTAHPRAFGPSSRTASSNVFWSRPVMATCAPSAKKSRAVARPMPLLPPVIRAFLPGELHNASVRRLNRQGVVNESFIYIFAKRCSGFRLAAHASPRKLQICSAAVSHVQGVPSA